MAFRGDRETLLSNEDEHDSPETRHSINIQSPRDRYYVCHIAFFLIGLAQLLPWNFLVTANNYWMYKFRDHANTTEQSYTKSIIYNKDKTELQTIFESYLAIASNAPFLLIFALSFSKHLKRLSETLKNCVSFVLLLLVMISITSFVLINTDNYQDTFFKLTLASVFLLNSAAAFIQANFAGLASLFPNDIMHLMVTGQAMSGLFAVIAQILTLVGNWSIIHSTFVYFLFADLIILGTLVIYFFISKTDFFLYYNSHSDLEDETTDFDFSVYKIVFKKMWPFCIALMLNFWVSLSVYPAVVVLVNPQTPFWTGKFFLPVCCFMIFNLCDFLGRYLGRFGLLPRERVGSLLSIALLRVGFVPLFIFCNVHPSRLPVVFNSEYYYITYMVLFGLSNGYIVLNVFVNGPLSVPSEYRKLSGFFLMLFLGLGLTFGSFTSSVIVKYLCLSD